MINWKNIPLLRFSIIKPNWTKSSNVSFFTLGFLFVFLFTRGNSFSQNPVWLIPANPSAITDLKSKVEKKGIEIRSESEWLQCISINLPAKFDLKRFCLENNCIAKPVLKLKSTSLSMIENTHLDVTIEQMNGAAFIREGLTGLGVKIGVTDAGYMYLDDSVRTSSLSQLWSSNQILSSHDFVTKMDTIAYHETYYTGRDSNYKERKNWLRQFRKELKLIYHSHGTEVLKMIAGIDSSGENQMGLAPNASYYLTRTEDGVKEFKEEEDYYIAALEWMHKQGVRVVNTSLGYGRGRKIKGSNYSPLEMNGSSMIAKAVHIASTQKNMLIVVAAGNDGDKRKWKVISTPADAEGALTVGSVLARFQKIGYSGVGPEYNTYLKPDVCAYSYQGTSLSAPAVCGFAACLLEANPSLSATELKRLIVRSSHLYPYGNNFIGYGVPLANRSLQLLEYPDWKFNNTREVHLKERSLKLDTVDVSIPTLTIFHKKNDVHLLKQEVISRDKKTNSFIVCPPKDAKRTTVQVGYFIYELFWD
ncbi:MAG: S8 family serine peptidase [Bacteroidetes bacterium]|nr:S8 family serine peptidase [Bacteroidota bacterium]